MENLLRESPSIIAFNVSWLAYNLQKSRNSGELKLPGFDQLTPEQLYTLSYANVSRKSICTNKGLEFIECVPRRRTWRVFFLEFHRIGVKVEITTSCYKFTFGDSNQYSLSTYINVEIPKWEKEFIRIWDCFLETVRENYIIQFLHNCNLW